MEIPLLKKDIPCQDSPICDRYINDEVVILEDSLVTCKAAKDIIKEELNWNIITVKNKEEAILALEEKKVTFFIFDNCIGENKNEGLDALDQVRAIDHEVFVAIYSAYNPKKTEKRAKKSEANLFKQKSVNIHQDIREITAEFIKYKRKIFNSKINAQLKLLEKKSNINIEGASHFGKSITQSKDRPRVSAPLKTAKVQKWDAPNIDAYKKAKLDNKWLKNHQNTYVAFVDGKFVDSDSSKQALLKRLNDSKEYIDKQKFFIKVEEDLVKETFPIVEEPSGSWQQDFIR